MLTRNATRILVLPHEPGTSITIRRLSWPQLEQARQVRQRAVFRSYAGSIEDVSPELLKKIRDASDTATTRKAADEVDLSEYDLATLLEAGIVDWTYDAPVTAETVGELDETTALYVAREIVRPTQRSEADKADTFLPLPPGAGG